MDSSASDPPTRDDLRRVQARVEGRLQEIDAHLVLTDGRFAAVGDRIDQTNRRADTIDRRHQTSDRRFDAIEHQIKHLHEDTGVELRRITNELDGCRRRLNQLFAAVALGSVIAIASLAAAMWCLGRHGAFGAGGTP